MGPSSVLQHTGIEVEDRRTDLQPTLGVEGQASSRGVADRYRIDGGAVRCTEDGLAPKRRARILQWEQIDWAAMGVQRLGRRAGVAQCYGQGQATLDRQWAWARPAPPGALQMQAARRPPGSSP